MAQQQEQFAFAAGFEFFVETLSFAAPELNLVFERRDLLSQVLDRGSHFAKLEQRQFVFFGELSVRDVRFGQLINQGLFALFQFAYQYFVGVDALQQIADDFVFINCRRCRVW